MQGIAAGVGVRGPPRTLPSIPHRARPQPSVGATIIHVAVIRPLCFGVTCTRTAGTGTSD